MRQLLRGSGFTPLIYAASLAVGVISMLAFYESPISPLPVPPLPDPPVGRFPPEHPIWPPPPKEPIKFHGAASVQHPIFVKPGHNLRYNLPNHFPQIHKKADNLYGIHGTHGTHGNQGTPQLRKHNTENNVIFPGSPTSTFADRSDDLNAISDASKLNTTTDIPETARKKNSPFLQHLPLLN